MADRVRIVVRDLRGFTEHLLQRLTLNITALLIEDTPVDTGWASSNWVPKIGRAYERLAGIRPSKPGAPGINLQPQSAGTVSILSYKFGPQIFISNGVPYIKRLNSGSSRKAPAAFIQSAILRGIRNTVSSSR